MDYEKYRDMPNAKVPRNIAASLKNGALRKALLTEGMARSMARHCCIEYRNLAKKLPQLYREMNGLES